MIQSFELAFRVGGVWTLDPFRPMYHDSAFEQAIRFTLIFIAIIVPVQFVLALTMALIVNSEIRGRSAFLLHLHPAARGIRPRGRPRLVARSSPSTAT